MRDIIIYSSLLAAVFSIFILIFPNSFKAWDRIILSKFKGKQVDLDKNNKKYVYWNRVAAALVLAISILLVVVVLVTER